MKTNNDAMSPSKQAAEQKQERITWDIRPLADAYACLKEIQLQAQASGKKSNADVVYWKGPKVQVLNKCTHQAHYYQFVPDPAHSSTITRGEAIGLYATAEGHHHFGDVPDWELINQTSEQQSEI